jgi:hypothetical protein
MTDGKLNNGHAFIHGDQTGPDATSGPTTNQPFSPRSSRAARPLPAPSTLLRGVPVLSCWLLLAGSLVVDKAFATHQYGTTRTRVATSGGRVDDSETASEIGAALLRIRALALDRSFPQLCVSVRCSSFPSCRAWPWSVLIGPYPGSAPTQILPVYPSCLHSAPCMTWLFNKA